MAWIPKGYQGMAAAISVCDVACLSSLGEAAADISANRLEHSADPSVSLLHRRSQ